MNELNKDTIQRWWDIFVGSGLVEVRILGRFQYSGYFRSVDTLLSAIEPYAAMPDEQIYFTLNTVNDACYGRQQSDRILKSPKATTTDSDIVARRWVMVDFDPRRSAGVNASEEELEYARVKARDVFRFLRERGFAEPVVCASGNGVHLQFRVDMDASAETTETVKRFLQALGLLFTDDKVDIDEKVFNLGRICKLYGTVAKKGANLTDRPWRMSEILYVPSELAVTGIDKFRAVADLVPKQEPTVHLSRGGSGAFDLAAFLDGHNVRYKAVSVPNGTKYVLDHCFFDESHKGKDAVLFQYNSGAISYVCLHNSCSHRTWRDVRLLLDPTAYDFESKPRDARFVRSEKPKYEIKDEIPELGGKWLSMSDIKKIDLTQLESVRTGFAELDKAIVGLNMSEVSLLSGSNSSGKSSWLNTLLLNVIEQGYKAALWSGELRPDILKAWIQMVAAGRNHLKPSQYHAGKYYVPNMVADAVDRWLDGKFFLYNNEYGCKWEQIFHDMAELQKAGVKIFVLDNLFTLDIDLFGGDKNNKQKELILQIKDFAKKNESHIILVAHPRKVMTFLRKNDISGTSDLTNAVDNVFIIHRVNQDFITAGFDFYGKVIHNYQEYGNVLEVAKNRMYGVVDYLVGLYYEEESRRFKNEPYEAVAYGWERELGGEQADLAMPYEPRAERDEDFLAPKPSAPF